MRSEPSVLPPDVSCCLAECGGEIEERVLHNSFFSSLSIPQSAYAKQGVGGREYPQKVERGKYRQRDSSTCHC